MRDTLNFNRKIIILFLSNYITKIQTNVIIKDQIYMHFNCKICMQTCTKKSKTFILKFQFLLNFIKIITDY